MSSIVYSHAACMKILIDEIFLFRMHMKLGWLLVACRLLLVNGIILHLTNVIFVTQEEFKFSSAVKLAYPQTQKRNNIEK